MTQHDTADLEAAVLSVIAGNPLEEAAAQARISPKQMAAAVELYREAGRAALDARPRPLGWHQLYVRFADYPNAVHAFNTHIRPGLDGAPGWWFIRKHPHWRLRFHLGADDTATAHIIQRVTQALTQASTRGVISAWQPSPYEPETLAFGGITGMAIAHDLFHTDSVGVLDYYRHHANGSGKLPDPKVTSLLVTACILRAAGLEWGEQGDVWGRIEALRVLPGDVPPSQITGMAPTMRKLLMLDLGEVVHHGALAPVRTWITGMERGAHRLAQAAERGQLHLGLRHILARLLLFHFNRMGHSSRQQAIWARAAREAILGPSDTR